MTTTGESRGRILVVDDEEPVGRLLQRWLVDEGYQAEYANGFAQAQEAVLRAQFDLVTLDILMPKTDGLTVLAWLREHHPDIGVLMATAVERLDVVLHAMRAGAVDYLLKPFSLELISEQIGRAMERQRLVAENRAYQRDLERLVAERTAALAAAHERLQHQVCELEARDRLVGFQMEAHTVSETQLEVLRILAQASEATSAVLYLLETGTATLRAVAARGLGPAIEDQATQEELEAIPALAVADASHVATAALVAGKPTQGTAGQVALPLRYRDRDLGVLFLTLPALPGDGTMDTLHRLAAEGAIALQGALILEQLDRGASGLGELGGLE